MEFTAEYVKLRDGRLPWKTDPEHDVFNARMRGERFTFDQVCKLCKAETILDPEASDEAKAAWLSARSRWEELVSDWNSVRERERDKKTEEAGEEGEGGAEQPVSAIGFVAVCYFFASLLCVLELVGKERVKELYTLHEINVLNVVYCYSTQYSHPLLIECGAQDPADMPPHFPPAWEQWFNDQYNQCSWWVCYMVYEKLRGWQHVLQNPK